MGEQEFIKQATEELFLAYPDWSEFKIKDTATGNVYIEVPKKRASSLIKSLYIIIDEEVTVGLDYYHCHFDLMAGSNEDLDEHKALPFIEKLISESVSIVSWWKDDRMICAGQMESGGSIDSDGYTGDFNRIRVRSWKGSYDQDIYA